MKRQRKAPEPPHKAFDPANGGKGTPGRDEAPESQPMPPAGQMVKSGQDAEAERARRLERVKKMHIPLIGDHVYRQQLGAFAKSKDIEATTFRYVADTLQRMNTRDPLEEMLVIQALWTHARLGRLAVIANEQTNANHIKVVNDACDRAANTYRRQMLALAEYRRPPRTDAFVAIKQANVAQQQVVANGQNPNSTKRVESNEQGSSPAPALPAHAEGTGIPPSISQAKEAVAAQHRTQDGGRESPIQAERDEAR